MREILTLEMGMIENKEGLSLKFRSSIVADIEKLLNKKEQEEMQKYIEKINETIVGAIKRDARKDMLNDIADMLSDKKCKEIYETLSDEDKKEVDEFEKELSECNDLQDALLLAIKTLTKHNK